MSRISLLIPVRGSDENVEVFADELPEDADDILAILQAEIAPLDIWLKFAVEYYRQGKIESFLKVLNEGTDPDLEEYYADSKTERIALLNALASYYTQLASRERDNNKKEEYYRQATGTFNKADKIDAFEFLTWVGKGVLFLCKGDLDRATYNFDTVLQNQPDNIPAIMGKACVQFNKGQYQEALATYKLILVKNPSCPPAVRLGLGYCFYKLGRTDLARQAFERVLQLDPTNVEALVGIAIFELNTEKQGSITSAMHMLKKAFEANSTNSMVLNHLANHFFFKKDYQKVHTLALQAYHNTEVVQIKAFSCYLLAKSYHAQNELENAYNYYAQALRHWPSFDLAQFGVAQMLIHKEQPDSAITYFESVLTSHPENFETLKILGSLYSQSKNKDKAKMYLKKATELNSGDYEAWIELAQLTELTDLPGALAAYEKAKQLLNKRKEKVSAELWNNLAVLRHKLGDLKGAEDAYKGALIASGNGAPDNSNEFTKEVKAQTVTMLYNLARLYEDMHEPVKAEELYMSILKEHPNYVDCYMRLGCIERDRKQYSAASTWFRECLVISQENHDTWALIGNMHLGKEEWQQAQKKFEKIIEKDRSDPYSLLSLGNIYYNAKFNTAEKEAKYVRLAHDFYWKVLQRNPSNIYAANGIGIVFAEKGEIALAKEFFTQVSESSENMADVRLNLAHIHFAQGLFINAVKLYQNCLKKYYENKDPDVILCLARAYFEWDKMEECKQTLQKAIHLDPTNQVFWFNLALAQYKSATMVLQQKTPRRTLSDLQSASKDANSAMSIFTTLSQPRSTVKPGYSVSKAQRYVKLCTQLQQVTQTQRQEAEKQEAEQAQRRAQQQEKQEEAERLLREKREREMAEEAEKNAEQERAVQQMMEHQNRVLEKYANPEPLPEEEGGEKRKKKKKGGKKKKSKKGDEEAEPQEEMQEEEGAEGEGMEEGAEGVEGAEGEGEEGAEQEESWEDMRNRRNPMAKELARRQKEREQAKLHEKKRRRGTAEDEEEEEEEEAQEKRKSKKSRGKRLVQEEEDEENEQPAEEAEGESEQMEQDQVEQTEQGEEEEQAEGESEPAAAEEEAADEPMDAETAASEELPPTQVD